MLYEDRSVSKKKISDLSVGMCGDTHAVDGTCTCTTYKLVKVGYYQADRFQEGDGKNVLRSGYSYEYLQKIASYTGWKYEYISGDWKTLYQKLENGEIDLLAGIAYDEDRSEKFCIRIMICCRKPFISIKTAMMLL